jgi:hypothetical protein
MTKTFRCTPIKDANGMLDIDVTEIYNVDNVEERYPTGFNQWRIGERIIESDILFHEGVAFNKNLFYGV